MIRGVHHVNLLVRELDASLAQAREAGARTTSEGPRRGFDGWRLIDLDPHDLHGAVIQLCEDRGGA